MIVDEEAFNKSDFTLMAKEEIASFGDDKEVFKLIKKYNITKSSSHLTNSKEILHIKLIQYVDNLYYLNKPIPEDIQQLIKENATYKNHLVAHVTKRLNSLRTDGSAIFFKEIVSVINLLSLGQTYTIFINYNEYDFDKIAKLFRQYESLLQIDYAKDHYNFEKLFDAYLTLIKSYSQLCIINSTDVNRKKTITPIINQITESINMLKFTVPLEEEFLNKLNNVLGEILFYFSHLPYIDAKDKQLYYLIDEFYLLLEKQTDGFNLSKESHFGGDEDLKESNYLTFLNNSSYLLLTMIQKLKFVFSDKDYYATRSFQKCLMLFASNFPMMAVVKENENLQSFTNKLLNGLVRNYHLEDEGLNTTLNYQSIIDDFIQTADNFDIMNIETIHNLLLFADDIDDYKYLNIGETLLHSELIQNDFYEFFKLKTIDIIINYFIKNPSKENILSFIKQVEYYVQQNKQASHLLSMYSKLNLSMAHYYAMKDEEQFTNKAKELYSIFINTNGIKLLKNEYLRINNDILISLGRYSVNDLELNPEKFDHARLMKLGQKLTDTYIQHNELKHKYRINEEFSSILSSILSNNNINYEEINSKISKIISDDIFYGLCEVRIKGLTKESAKIVDNGYMLFSIPMINKSYILQFIFPSVYENEFKYILRDNKEFITNNINNILACFKRSSASIIDEISGLKNQNRLRSDIQEYKNEEIIFIEILLGSLPAINKKYGFETGNKFLRAISQKIASLINSNDEIYYMNGGRFGIILSSLNEYETLIKKIENIKIKKDKENVDMGLTIAVTQSTASSILEDSSQLLDKALTSKSKILFNIK